VPNRFFSPVSLRRSLAEETPLLAPYLPVTVERCPVFGDWALFALTSVWFFKLEFPMACWDIIGPAYLMGQSRPWLWGCGLAKRPGERKTSKSVREVGPPETSSNFYVLSDGTRAVIVSKEKPRHSVFAWFFLVRRP